MTQPPLLGKIIQIGLVVHSVERTAREYWNEFGVGPWKFYTFDPSNVTDMRVRGERVDHAMRIAIAMLGDMEWEIIEPLDDRSIYAEHLRARGESLHHIQFAVEDYEKVCEQFVRTGSPEIASGNSYGYRYAYFDTTHSLGCLTEIFAPPPQGAALRPIEHTYP